MMKNIPFVFILIFPWLLAGCIDAIKLDIDTNRQWLVVDGQVTDSLQVHEIKLNYSAIIGVGADDLKTPAPGATVRVVDNTGESFDFPESSPGVYSRLMQGVVGKAYHVEVRMPDGKAIISRPAVLKKAPPLLPATARVTQELIISQTGRNLYDNTFFLEMNADVSGLPEKPYLRWRASGEYEFGEDYPGIVDRKICYVKNTIDNNNIKIFDTNSLAGDVLVNEPFLSMKYDYRFAFQYCFHLFQYAISEEEYTYWQNVRNIVNIDGSLFDPPPGTVKGNVYNPDDPEDVILGYFSVAGVTYRRQFTNAIQLGVSSPPRCAWRPNQQQYQECRDCLTIKRSTTTRPDYWEP